jgi:uncharacterized protein DUF5662
MITSESVKPPLDRMPPSAFSFERSLDPWHEDAFPPEFKDSGSKGERAQGWAVLDFWKNEIGFIPDGTKYDDSVFDSTRDTKDHINKVGELLGEIVNDLTLRAAVHDASKLQSPEKELFDKYTPLLRDTTYGSDQYKKYLEEMGPALDHHYLNNPHHPEYHPKPEGEEIGLIRKYIDGMKAEDPAREWLLDYLKERESRLNYMSLPDIIEMLADWKAASLRHSDGSIEASLDINRKRFGISDQLFQILRNTVRERGW